MVSSIIRNPKTQQLLRYLVDFTKRNPIHGISYLAKMNIHWVEFLYWILCLLLMSSFGLKSGIQLLEDYRSRNSAITVNIDYIQLKTQYPTATICPHDILDPKKVEEYVNNFNGKMDKDELITFLRTLSKISGKIAYHHDLANNPIPAKDYMQLIFNLSHTYDVTLRGQPTVKVMTEVGICYAVFNLLAEEISTKNWGDLQPYPKKLADRFKPNTKTFNFTRQYPTYAEIQHNISGNMTIYLHPPNEVPTIWSRPATITSKPELIKIAFVVKDVTFKELLLKETTIKERRCRNTSESNLKMFPSTYSRNLCLMECRANYIEKLCKCIPHFYRNKNWKHVAICDVQGLNCFAHHIGVFRKINANTKSPIFKCYHCYPNCIDQMMVTEVINFKTKKNNGSITFGIEYPPLESFERSVMYTKLDYVVTLSSVLSAFFGFCVYSLCDFIYFFTIRIYWFRKGYRGSVDENYLS